MRAVILGGTGLIGRATARRLVDSGWHVELVGRDPGHLPEDLVVDEVRFVHAPRDDDSNLSSTLGDGCDLLVDCLCYNAEGAKQLQKYAQRCSSTVMISSKGVYVDDFGHHSNSNEPPHFPLPITETQATVAPSGGDGRSSVGYGANKVAAETILLDSALPITVLRPSKIHGAGARPPREWHFLKRVLDGRRALLLVNGGRGIDHPTAAANLAALIEVVAGKPGRRVLNCGDPDAPSALEISRTVARYMGHEWEEVLLDDDSELGKHPWNAPFPIVLDMSAATALGYKPAGNYANTVSEEIDWLVRDSRLGDGAALPAGYDGSYFDGLFDYDHEDSYLAAR